MTDSGLSIDHLPAQRRPLGRWLVAGLGLGGGLLAWLLGQDSLQTGLTVTGLTDWVVSTGSPLLARVWLVALDLFVWDDALERALALVGLGSALLALGWPRR